MKLAVGLTTDNFDDVLVFYRDVIGLPVAEEGEGYVVLLAGETRLGITTLEGYEWAGSHGGGIWLELVVDDLPSVEARLADSSMPVLREWESPQGFRYIAVSDPDGHRLRLLDGFTPSR